MITGTPPIRRGALSEGFVASPAAGLPGRAELSASEAADFARLMFGEPAPTFLSRAIRRADGRCRVGLFAASMPGQGVDQRLAVEGSSIPIAVVNGDTDPVVRLDYVESIAFGNLWDGRCHRLPGAGHAAFWRSADAFNALLERFLGDVWRGRGDRRRRGQ